MQPNKLCEDYARLCALGFAAPRSFFKLKYGREQFPILCTVPQVKMIGVNLEESKLFIGTTTIVLEGYEIGEFIVTINKKERTFRFQNLTRTVAMYHHPHVDTEGWICMASGKEEIHLAIVDGNFVLACRLILQALNTIDRHPFPSAMLHMWPKIEGV